ncbi:MAG: hypothetical protein L3J69_07090 [Desulfobacula sp.]|nr:hypothetical protein [Desulfobacula sp.]
MKKLNISYLALLTFVFLFLSFYPEFADAKKTTKDNSIEPDFLTDTLYTDPIELERVDEEQQIELVIARWGTNTKESKFKLSIVSVPSFIKDVRWIAGSNLSFKPEETEKKVILSFKTSAAQKSRNQDLILLVTSSDPKLVPGKRKIILPFNGPVNTEAGPKSTAYFFINPSKVNSGSFFKSDGLFQFDFPFLGLSSLI